MGGKILLIFILVVALGVGLYVYNSGVVGKGFNYLDSLASRSSTLPTFGTTGTSATPGRELAPPDNTAVSAPRDRYSATSTVSPAEIPAGFTANQLSPYFHEVRFGGVSPARSYSSYGEISLYAYPNVTTSSIDVTGWQVRANHGGEYIPQAVNVYDPLGLNPVSDIWLKSGSDLNLYSTSAPVNLRLNKCIGYLPNGKTQFVPQLPQTCPSIDQSVIHSFTGACQSYIMSLNGCAEANMSNPLIPQNDYACINYLENNFSYHSCFEAHEGDANFLSNQIWVFNGSSPLDPLHDQVKLLDRNGLLVDFYTY